MSISYDSSAPGIARHARSTRKKPRKTKAQPAELGDQGYATAPRSILIKVIEGEIIPRLLLAHQTRSLTAATPGEPDLPDVRSDAFVGLFLNGDKTAIVERLRLSIDRGVDRKHLYLDVLAPIARTLGLLWEEGRCTFEELAVGLACIDPVLRDIDAMPRAADPAKTT